MAYSNDYQDGIDSVFEEMLVDIAECNVNGIYIEEALHRAYRKLLGTTISDTEVDQLVNDTVDAVAEQLGRYHVTIKSIEKLGIKSGFDYVWDKARSGSLAYELPSQFDETLTDAVAEMRDAVVPIIEDAGYTV